MIQTRYTDYIRETFAREDEVLEAIRRKAHEDGILGLLISADVGALLAVLIRAAGVKTILELGSAYGYSAIWLARALPPGGRLTGIDSSPERAETAREFVAQAGLGDRVEFRVGKVLEVLPGLSAERFDAIFIDADKREYPAYLDWALDHVNPGGLILADNTLAGGSDLDILAEPESSEVVRAVREFNERLASDRRLTSIIIPVRQGVSVSVVGSAAVD